MLWHRAEAPGSANDQGVDHPHANSAGDGSCFNAEGDHGGFCAQQARFGGDIDRLILIRESAATAKRGMGEGFIFDNLTERRGFANVDVYADKGTCRHS